MTIKEHYTAFEFTDLIDRNNQDQEGEWDEFTHLQIDKIYLSGDYPALFFKEVRNFDKSTLKEIAKAHHLIWNYRKVMFLMVPSISEVRIYNCSKKPFNYEIEEIDIERELLNLEIIRGSWNDEKSLKIIKELFSRSAVDCGTLWSTENQLRDKIDVQQRIDRYLVKSLLNTAQELKLAGMKDEIIHRLLMRSIFIMYLEDKGAAKETRLYSSILSSAESYLDILEDKVATFTLFRKLEEHFNGNVFPILKGEENQVKEKHLKIVQKCLVDGDLSNNPKLFKWRIFRFDIIQIELLSEIYENFLEEFKELSKEEGGQYYTPPSLVELILNEKLKTKNNIEYNLKILDPACGSGIFLVESFKRLIKRWKNANPGQQITFLDLKKILTENIFGIELDKLAIRVAAFSLYLTIVEQLNPKTLWIDRRYKFPYLINDPTDNNIQSQGRNLYRADTIGDIDIKTFGKIDLVVGNPPFGSKIKLPSVKQFCIAHGYGQDMVIPFLRKAVDFAEGGSVALIFNTKVLTNTEKPFQKFRKWLFNDAYVEKIYNLSIFRKAPKTFGGQLFTSAVGPVSILFYEKYPPANPSATIEYWAPKTYVKNSLVEGVLIDATDIKFLPREECQNPESKIWKIGMWGTYEDFKLISRLNDFPTLKSVIKENQINKGLGLQFLDKSTIKPLPDSEIPKLPYIKPEKIRRYFTPTDNFDKLIEGVTEKSKIKYREYFNLPESKTLSSINVFRRLGNKKAFKGPHVLIKEGLSNKQLCASFIEQDCSFNSKVLGLSNSSDEILKSIACLINSDLATYYLFLISASIGIEREEIKPNEIYDLPFSNEKSHFKDLSKILDQIKNSIVENLPFQDFKNFEEAINTLVTKLFALNENEQILISDFFKYTIGLIFEGYKSSSLKFISSEENKLYATKICSELNGFIDDNQYVVNASIYDTDHHIPLNIIKLTFDSSKKELHKFNSDKYKEYLDEINKYSIRKLSKNIFIQKQIKYFSSEEDLIYIIKPNQKRFWSRSMAINDSKELIGEILQMKT